ncbi:MAG: hypothetical protein IH848_10940, partial [Acidobacteria bacterium]|nr:hypothetical protein [Acidobacteriota bacterium]
QVCQNSLLPDAIGLIQAFTTIVLTGGSIALIATAITDNGDDDVWADSGETVDMTITLRNQTGILLNNVQARLATNDPKIDCLINPILNIGTMIPDDPATPFIEGEVTSTEAFTFRIASSANRTGTCSISMAVCSQDVDCTGGGTCDSELQDFSAVMNVFITSDEVHTAFAPQVVVLALDLDAAGGGTPTEIVEGFEGGLGIFGIDNMDSAVVADGAVVLGIPGTGGHGGSLVNSDGYRCSFADPDYVNAFTYQDPDCFMGINAAHANDVWWEVITERAFAGNQSLAYASRIDDVLLWTTPTGVMEAVQLLTPVALGYKDVCSNAPLTSCPGGDSDCPGALAGSCVQTAPRAVWKHQVSLLDFRTVNASGPLRSADGGVIHVQLADPATDNPAGNWIKVETVSNQYDSQREDNYNVCSFDPIDDGNDEDDFFDPADPFRRFGPSSTCFPEFVYTYMGDTDSAWDALSLGNATQPPGLEGDFGPGTWVESVVDLSLFRAQYVRIRMLATSLKVAGSTTWQTAFNFSTSVAGDDGWFIDDFHIKDAITAPATAEGDVNPNLSVCSGDNVTACVNDGDCTVAGGVCLFPGCGGICNVVTALLDADPSTPLAAPGQVVELNAFDSFADLCSGGVLQYRFWIDENGNQTGFESGTDTLLRNWSENGILLEAPNNDTNYAMDARCSALTTCVDTAYNTVVVTCPSSAGGAFPTVTADGSNNKNDFQWAGGAIDYAYG